MQINIFTDGACSNNGFQDANGGWGVVIMQNEQIINLKHGSTKDTTNNREELQAVLQALKELAYINLYTDGKIEADIYTDSAYVYGICTDWGWKWLERGWTRAGNKSIKNLDLIQSIFHYLYNNKNFAKCQINFFKVPGHASILGNELADALATNDIKRVEKIIGRNPELMGVNINETEF